MHSIPERPWLRGLVAAALGTVLLVIPGACPTRAAPASPDVHPVPQSVRPRAETLRIPSTVSLVTGGTADATATAAVREILSKAGVRTVRDGARFSVHVGGGSDALGVRGPAGLPAEGYVLATGTDSDGQAHVVLHGVDRAGTFYAAQTLRQLVRGSRLQGVEIRDWPSLRRRGVVEGFYGPPWTDDERLRQLDYYGRVKLNTYVYTPKDDPYLRAEWRKPYPADRLARLAALVERARANHVDFSYVLSPGLSVCFARPSEVEALIAKFENLAAIGVRTFVIAFDDIDYERWHCDEDRAQFGTGPAAAATAQAHLVNRVQRDFAAGRAGTTLETVPTEYWNLGRTEYKRVLANDLDPAVTVQWTGLDVIAPTITRADVAAARELFGHPILLWDNYPVNDYVPGRLLLGPFVGREAGLSTSVDGLTANPMPQAQASRTSVFTVADYSWNDAAYDPATSWAAGLSDLAGGDARTTDALRAFADVNYSSRLDPRESPRLAAELATFWSAWSTGRSGADRLRSVLTRLHEAPAVLRARLDNPGFLAETKPWLDATEAWSHAALAALDMLTAQRAGGGDRAWATRNALPGLRAKARSFTWTGNSTVAVEIDGTLDRFLTDALAESTRWLGVTAVTPTTNLPPLDGRFPAANMTDGDPSTYFWGATGAQPGHHVGVDLGAIRPVTGVDVLMGKSDSPDDHLHRGVLEHSTDGVAWTRGPAFGGTAEVRLDLPAGTRARYVRLRATEGQSNWVVVREFTVRRGDVPGTDARFAKAVDGNLGTAYQADAAPSEPLTVTLPAARPLRSVLVLGNARAEVQVRTGAGWRGIGALSGGYSELPAGGHATAIRLVWLPGSPPPVVNEIVPVYDDAAPATISVTPALLDLDTGGSAPVTAVVASARTEDMPVTVAASPPAGITVAGAKRSFILHRGASASLPLQVTVGAAVATGVHTVPITLRSPRGTTTSAVKVAVWPRTTDTNVARAGTATVSQVEDDLPQFAAAKTIDGDSSTRWSSPWSDDQWLQVELPQAQRVGRVVLKWESAHARAYEIRTSGDGVTWTTAASVTDSAGGVETVRLDAPGTRFVRMQGLSRATGFGYSLYEFEIYAVTAA